MRFVCAFGEGGFFLLLVVSVGIDVGWALSLVRVSGCAEAKAIDDGDELELEDVGTKKMINRF